MIVLIWLLSITGGLLLNWAEARTVTAARPDITITDVSGKVSLIEGKLKLRLHDIDAPERKQICTNTNG